MVENLFQLDDRKFTAATAGPQENTTHIPDPDPSSLLSPLSVSTSVINVLANLFLPTIPAAFLYTVAEILGE